MTVADSQGFAVEESGVPVVKSWRKRLIIEGILLWVLRLFCFECFLYCFLVINHHHLHGYIGAIITSNF
jgi:hypothetical protein